jgi:integrase
MRLTRDTIASLVQPAGKDDVVFWDDTLPGFGIRLRGDSRRWLIQYRAGPQQRRESLGDVRKVTLEAARKVARQRFAQVELGIDPALEKAKRTIEATATVLTFGSVVDRYLDTIRGELRHSTYRAAQLHLAEHWKPLARRPIGSIGRADVAAQLQTLVKERGRIAAARSRANLSALFSWAMREALVDSNPVVGTNQPDRSVGPRERVLGSDELVAIWKAAGADDHRGGDDDHRGGIIRLLILLGCRRQEIGGLLWSEVDLDRGSLTIGSERTKNHRALTLALPPAALAILSVPRRGEFVFGGDHAFSSWSALKAQIDVSSGVRAWRLHDIRRSVATHMADTGVAPHVIEQILNHQSGHKRGPAGIYNRSSYEREVRAALALWADHIRALVEGSERKVLAFPA